MNDGIQCDRYSRVQSQDHMPKRVAYKQDVDACPVEKPRHGGIVGGQHHDPLASPFHQGKIRHAQLLWYRVHSAVLKISSISAAFASGRPRSKAIWTTICPAEQYNCLKEAGRAWRPFR